MNTNVYIFSAIAVVGLASCDRTKSKPPQTQPHKPASFRETMFTNVTPTADGDAYAIGFDSGLWYLRGSQAVRVRFANVPSEPDEAFYLSLQITPLLDGGAYAHSLVDKSFWHLHADTAARVAEVLALSNAPLTAPVSAFPLYVAERQKRIEAEEELEQCRNPDLHRARAGVAAMRSNHALQRTAPRSDA